MRLISKVVNRVVAHFSGFHLRLSLSNSRLVRSMAAPLYAPPIGGAQLRGRRFVTTCFRTQESRIAREPTRQSDRAACRASSSSQVANRSIAATSTTYLLTRGG